MTKGHWRVRAIAAGTSIGIAALTIFLTTAPGNAQPVSLTWTTRATMPTARFYFGMATDSSGAIYAFGGYNGTETLVGGGQAPLPAAPRCVAGAGELRAGQAGPRGARWCHGERGEHQRRAGWACQP